LAELSNTIFHPFGPEPPWRILDFCNDPALHEHGYLALCILGKDFANRPRRAPDTILRSLAYQPISAPG